MLARYASQLHLTSWYFLFLHSSSWNCFSSRSDRRCPLVCWSQVVFVTNFLPKLFPLFPFFPYLRLVFFVPHVRPCSVIPLLQFVFFLNVFNALSACQGPILALWAVFLGNREKFSDHRSRTSSLSFVSLTLLWSSEERKWKQNEFRGNFVITYLNKTRLQSQLYLSTPNNN